MRQVIFCMTRWGRCQSRTGASACTVSAKSDERIACPGLPGFASRQLQHCSLRIACFPAHHHRRADLARLTDSLAGDPAPHSTAHCLDRCNVGLQRLPMLLERAVTLALHACNAKKNFAASVLLQSSILPIFACNARQGPPIFSKNASVIFAVDSSIDRMMLNRNHTADFPRRPNFVGRTRATRRVLSALPPHATERGAP